MKLSQIIKLSRPHFWLYEFGTFLMGALAAMTVSGPIVSWQLIVFGFYFLIPANILIYGINDVFDYETDMRNPKKNSYEDVLPKEKHQTIFYWILFTTIPFIALFPYLSLGAILALILFIFFATFYSTPPIRAKIRPGLDSLFSGSHYVVTALVGFYIVSPNAQVNWPLILAGLLWTTAMHAYSAIPDIQADAESGIETIATRLGKQKTLLFCLAAYVLSFNIVSMIITDWFAALSIPYIILVVQSWKQEEEKLLSTYKKFAYLNAVIGAFFSIYLLLQLF